MDTDGEGVGQRAQTGYLFILNVLFRPALMVVGLLLGMMMVDIMTNYVMALFPIIIANASMNSWTGLIKMAAYIAAFVIILQMVVNMSFQLIRFVPDQVLGWIGGNQTNNIGAQAADEVGGAAKNALAARGTLSGAFSKQQAEGEKKAQAASTKESQAQTLDHRNRQTAALEGMSQFMATSPKTQSDAGETEKEDDTANVDTNAPTTTPPTTKKG